MEKINYLIEDLKDDCKRIAKNTKNTSKNICAYKLSADGFSCRIITIYPVAKLYNRGEGGGSPVCQDLGTRYNILLRIQKKNKHECLSVEKKQCCGTVNISSGSGRPINYRSGWVRILPGHFCGHEHIWCQIL
jgi:hypothetical protein